MDIIEFIPTGAENAITARQIASLAKCDTRSVRAAIYDRMTGQTRMEGFL